MRKLEINTYYYDNMHTCDNTTEMGLYLSGSKLRNNCNISVVCPPLKNEK